MAITEIASLTTMKQYLRIPNPSAANGDDATIQILMNAAQVAIEREVGHIIKKRIRAERHSGGKCDIWLRELPVLYVENVEEGWGYYNWELDDQQVNMIPALSMWAFSLDRPEEGLVTRRSQGNVAVPFVWGKDNIRVDYVVGRAEIPDNAVLAFLELTAYWYRTSQLRGTNQATGFAPAGALNVDFTRSTGISSVNMGIPDEIIELLKPDRRRPIIG
jgi:hypothetical protein